MNAKKKRMQNLERFLWNYIDQIRDEIIDRLSYEEVEAVVSYDGDKAIQVLRDVDNLLGEAGCRIYYWLLPPESRKDLQKCVNNMKRNSLKTKVEPKG